LFLAGYVIVVFNVVFDTYFADDFTYGSNNPTNSVAALEDDG